MTQQIEYVTGHTYHGRRGQVRNAFRYSIDCVLFDAEASLTRPALFSRNRRNIASVHDRDNGGKIGNGTGPAWVRDVMARHQLPQPARIRLLTQPRLLGHAFNPVSFWFCYGDDEAKMLQAVIAEVTNTFGERHSYLCHHADLRPIKPADRLTARKAFYVSPFQPAGGEHTFCFDIGPEHIGIRIVLNRGAGGLIATLTGTRKKMTNRDILWSCLRRPFGTRRVLALIHWQAAVLWWKRVPFRVRPLPPQRDVTRR